MPNILHYRFHKKRRHTVPDPRPFLNETAINLELARSAEANSAYEMIV
jgi:hypothetical protein